MEKKRKKFVSSKTIKKNIFINFKYVKGNDIYAN